MGELVIFERGCRGCEHLVQIGHNTYRCETRVHMDDSDVIPVKDGKHTRDWDICSGEFYVRSTKSYSKVGGK